MPCAVVCSARVSCTLDAISGWIVRSLQPRPPDHSQQWRHQDWHLTAYTKRVASVSASILPLALTSDPIARLRFPHQVRLSCQRTKFGTAPNCDHSLLWVGSMQAKNQHLTINSWQPSCYQPRHQVIITQLHGPIVTRTRYAGNRHLSTEQVRQPGLSVIIYRLRSDY